MICPLKCGVHGALLMRWQIERPLKRSALLLCCSASISCCRQSIIARDTLLLLPCLTYSSYVRGSSGIKG